MYVDGVVRVPGDKSITHRALLLGALAPGVSHVGGALTSLDAKSSARVLRAMGVEISSLAPGRVVTIRGRRRLQAPSHRLHCGNSGTTTRLLLGLLAGHRFRAELTGDASLRRRPMRRVTQLLQAMGARFEELGRGDGLPLAIRGGALRSARLELPVSSAQLKSAVLLAGMVGGVEVAVHEPHGVSRDHTERLLASFGFTVQTDARGWIHFAPTGRLEAFDLQVPGDPSSAAFLAGAAALAEGGAVRLARTGVNPTRIGFLHVLERMGVPLAMDNLETVHGEPLADLLVRAPTTLSATEVTAREIPGLIDEVPILAVVASRARGTTIFRDVGELRVKESDRLALIADNLRAVGVQAQVHGDDLHVDGTETPPRGRVVTAGDHRLAMAFAVLGTVPGARVKVDDMACADVSFPGFPDALRSIRVRGRR
jgi:3-phosphoshikimate 1-carboxyvinyltransferase